EVLKEVLYEGFGPEGTGYIVHATTDNTNRTHNQVRTVFERNGGKMGVPGSLQYLFTIERDPEFMCTPHFPVTVRHEPAVSEIVKLMSGLEHLDDVQQVFTNVQFDLEDESNE
ncbi:YebC/PmpR family DNA-binding transcriptional regulator, partial [Candidatus Microgenomates bacterium]|nr:YebC/PmpR family DNA-binding transcriptional regulator [Candidatus Microgenomates bacterium]